MLMQEERELVVEYGRKMSTDRLSTGTSGNISVCNAEKGLMAISPSGMDYFSTTPEDVVITDLEANIVDGVRKPSSEWALHTAFYRHKPHARAVCTPTPCTAPPLPCWASPFGLSTMQSATPEQPPSPARRTASSAQRSWQRPP